MQTAMLGADGDQHHGNREKSFADVEVKEECDEEKYAGSPRNGNTDTTRSWLYIKEEIKEEMQQDEIGPLSVAATTVEYKINQEVKEEVEEKVDLGQDSVEPATTPTTKRRRLTRRNMQGKAAAAGATETLVQAFIKKEKPDDIQVKQEESDDQDAHALWLQVKKEIKDEMQQDQIDCLGVGTAIARHEVKQEVKEEVEEKDVGSDPVGLAISSTPPSKKRHLARKETKIKREKSDDRKAPQDKPDGRWPQVKSEIKEELGKEDSTADSIKIKKEHIVDAGSRLPPSKEAASADDASLDTFAAAAATWAQQCLAFRKTKTWTPTRPCCPANFFVGPVDGVPTAPAEHAPACVQRLSAYRLRCLRRFHRNHDPQTLLAEEVPAESPMRFASPKKDRALSPEELLLAEQDIKVRGLDLMKMWPWMRDLPTCLWAGRGWAFDENGLRRLSTSGGSDAMEGVEVWDSVGQAPEEVKPMEEIVKEATAAATAGFSSEGPATSEKPVRFRRDNSGKQSGVPDVTWHPA
ncbi:Uncharacterized protein SCF082_LOCUS18862, partial [Durusdinium trenchii]